MNIRRYTEKTIQLTEISIMSNVITQSVFAERCQ